MSDRSLLPSNEIAEQSVLGSILAAPDEYAGLVDELRPEFFYFTKHTALCQSLKAMRAGGLAIDVQGILATLKHRDELEKVGGASYLSILMDSIAADPAYHLRLVREAYTKRSAVEAGNALMKAGQDGLGAAEVVSKARDLVAGLVKSGEGDPAGRPLIPEETRVQGVLTERPAEAEPLIMLHGRPLILPGTVNMVAAAGGTGKTRMLIQLMLAAAAGRSWAFFQIPKPLRVLALLAEEDQDEVDRRLWDAGAGSFPDGLFVRSVKGTAGPIMLLEGGTPKRGPWFDWLDRTLENHSPLDLLILDPKSRFYGLNELDNDHATQWIASLEKLTIRHRLAVLFSHHVPKGTTEINQWMARGGGALVDACRSVLGMVPLDAKTAARLGISDPEKTVAVGISKINYGPKSAGESYLIFDDAGNLAPISLAGLRAERIGRALLEILHADGGAYSRRELEKEPRGKAISDKLEQRFSSFRRRTDLPPAIDHLVKIGLLFERAESSGKRPKMVLRPGVITDTDITDNNGHGVCVRNQQTEIFTDSVK